MTKRVLMVASAASLALALGTGTAAADHHEENPCGAANPCATPNPCGGENPCAAATTPEGEGGGDVEGDAAASGGDHGLTLAPGQISVGISIVGNLGEDRIMKPVSISPDIWYGVMPNLTIGLAHSSYGTFGFLGGAGTSLCITGKDNGCGNAAGKNQVYTNGLLEGRYQFLSDGNILLAGQLGLGVLAIDPDVLLDVKVGLMARFLTGGPVMVDVNPNVFIGVTERDAGNEQFLFVPVNLSVMAAPNVGLMLQTGVAGPFEKFGDNYTVPVSVGGVFWVTPMIGLAAAFTAGGVLTGAKNDDAFDQREASLAFLWHN